MSVFWPNGNHASKPPPFPGRVHSGFRSTSEFGMRMHPITGRPTTMHLGIDLVGWASILSPVDGIVENAGWIGGYGNLVEVRAADGTKFGMAHNRSLAVHRGQRVTAKQFLAVMGTTGNSTGVHCHFEVEQFGRKVNPRDYMKGVPVPKPPAPPKEVFSMATEVIVTSKNNSNQPLADKDRRLAFVNTESGFVSGISWLTLADADAYAKQVGMPAGALRFSDAGFDKFVGDLAAVRS